MPRTGILCWKGQTLSMRIICVLGSGISALMLMTSIYSVTWRAERNYGHVLERRHTDSDFLQENTSSTSRPSWTNHFKATGDYWQFPWDRQYMKKAPFYIGDREGRAKRLPDVILIGAPKGGTFALIQFLGFHPDIVIAQEDVDFFHVEDNFRQGYEWYLRRLPRSLPGQLTMEKSPRYMYYNKVAKRIYRMNKDVKLLVTVREPVERTVSCYVHRLATFARENTFYNTTFGEMAVNNRNGRVRFDDSCIDTTLYSKHLTHWYKSFPASQIHIVNGDRFITEPYAEIKRIEAYLKLKPWFAENMFRYNDTKRFFCFIKPPKNKEVCMPERKGRDHPPVDPVTVDKLRDYFRPYNDKLYEMAGQNFMWDEI